MVDRNQQILVLARAATAAFSSSDWTELGYLTQTEDWIDGHPRLLRSLSWGDSDYRGHVMDAMAHILKEDPDNLKVLLEYEPLAKWLRENEPGDFEQLRSDAFGVEVPEVVPTVATHVGFEALADAQSLLRTRGPTSAVDRVHTGLHAFLKGACDAAGMNPEPQASANQLLKMLLAQHPALANLGPRAEDIRKMIRASASIIDAMGTLRNNASLAHPNANLLDADEALLAINLARSLLHFLDAKLSPNQP